MKLIHDDTRDTWQFMQGESVIPLDGVNTFASREQAISTARQQGLAVDKTGSVAVAARARSRVPNSKSRNNKPRAQKPKADTNGRRRITLWLDPASIDILDQLAQAHGSRTDVMHWLLAQNAREPG